MRNCPPIKFIERSPGLSAPPLRWRDESCIRECMQRVQVAVPVNRISEVCKQPAPRADALRHPHKLCAATGTVAPPLLYGRNSVASTTRAAPIIDVCKHRCDREPKVGKRPAPPHHRPSTLSPPVRGHRDGAMLASGTRRPLPSPTDPSKQRARTNSSRCATPLTFHHQFDRRFWPLARSGGRNPGVPKLTARPREVTVLR